MGFIVLIATLDTKASQIRHLAEALAQEGWTTRTLDISLGAAGAVWGGEAKTRRMREVAALAREQLSTLVAEGACGVLGLGGGTGGEMILEIMEPQPISLPQLLVTTLPFDPRARVARSCVALLPTPVDVSGHDPLLLQALDRAAAMMAGMARAQTRPPGERSIAVTCLGATQAGADSLADALGAAGYDVAFFHANGYGGAAFARLVREGRFRAVVDYTPHELTRIHLGGAHVDMPDRFLAAGATGAPLALLPGGLNFIGLGALDAVPDVLRQRPHYAHSNLFTHVQVTEREMETLCLHLAKALNAGGNKAAVVAPMGGFSHQDAPGGAIENAALRRVFLEAMRARLRADIPVHAIDAHINHPDTATFVAGLVRAFL